jgi:hypothetical protein
LGISVAHCLSSRSEETIRYRRRFRRTCIVAGNSERKVMTMKYFVSMLAIASALALTGPAFAQDAPANKADCEAAGGIWDAANSACAEKE